MCALVTLCGGCSVAVVGGRGWRVEGGRMVVGRWWSEV